MLFALKQLLILSICLPALCGNDVNDRSAEATSHFASTTVRPLPHRNQTKITRNDQLLSLLANRRRQIIENRFKNHLKTIVELTKTGHAAANASRKLDNVPNSTTTVNIHLKLSDILHNTVGNSSGEQHLPVTEPNIFNVTQPKTTKEDKHVYPTANARETLQAAENKGIPKANIPIIRNILFRRKMSYLNRKLPLDFDQITYDTLGLSEIGKLPDDVITDAEDSLQVEESSHDKLIYYDVKNNSTKHSLNNFDDVSEETKVMSINKEFNHNNKTTPEITNGKRKNIRTNVSKNGQTAEIVEPISQKEEQTVKTVDKVNLRDNKVDNKTKNNSHFMSKSLYNYFRPPEDVPEEEMQPFLHFGDKLSSKHHMPKNQSSKITQLVTKENIFMDENSTHKHEDEVDENMDVSVTKPIYENKIPKVIVPNQKAVVQTYRNRSFSKLDAKNATKPEKTRHTSVPRIVSRNRGFRNRTIFFHQKRNGVRQTINLRPNITIADLKPNTSIVHEPNVTSKPKDILVNNIKNTTIEKYNKTESMTVLTVNNTITNKTSEIQLKNESKIVNVTNLGLIETSTESVILENVPEISTEVTTKRVKPTEKLKQIPEQTTIQSVKRVLTTVITPTTRVLSTDVVTSISVKSTITEQGNKTVNATLLPNVNNVNITIINKTDPEATVIAQLNNFTSQSFKHNLTNLNVANSANISTNIKLNLPTFLPPSSTIKIKSDIKLPTPVFYLNKTDFIIHVPDTEPTTNAELFASENVKSETILTGSVESTTISQVSEDTQFNARTTHQDVTEKEITNVTSTTRSKTYVTTTTSLFFNKDRENVTPENIATKKIVNKTQQKNAFSVNETQSVQHKNKFNLYNASVDLNIDTASELPLATLFNVKDFDKKEQPKNATSPSIIIPGTETVIFKRKDNNQSFDNIHAAYILASLGLIPMAIILVYVARNLMRRKNKCFEDFETELQEDKANIITPVVRLPVLVVDSSTKWEFARSKLRLQTLLGQGNFGQVWKAEADDLKGHIGLTRLVAVKTVKDGSGDKETDDLLKELAIMQKMGSHPNVVTLLGCCTEKEPYLLIMEYVMYGKLLTYLRDHRTRRDYFNFSDDAATLTARDLTVFAYCVARGMEYLGTKGIIHRDLAARNILVDHNKLCKIADFGMSRDCHGEEITEPRAARNALPVRWMAIESLLYSVFTFKTDVWSFGVLLWEIVTLGSSPYANMSGREVMRLICEGYRLERPNHCKPELYNVMARTWNDDPDQRPSFTELRIELADMLENTAVEGSYVDLESFRADSTVYEIDNCTPRGNYFEVKSRFSEFECDI